MQVSSRSYIIYDENVNDLDVWGIDSLIQCPNTKYYHRGVPTMNVCHVYGGTKKQKKLVEDTISWCFKRLTPRHRTICINVEIQKDFEFHGECSVASGRNEFDMVLRQTLNQEDFLTTIFHEMVHIMQYAKGMMKDRNSDGSKVYWRGYEYTNYPYCRQPWERQAYRMQEILLKEWNKKNVRNT